MDYISEAHGPEGRIPHLRAQHRAPRSAPGGGSAGTRALRRRRRTSLRSPLAPSRTRLCLKVSGRPPPLRRGSGGLSLPRQRTAGCSPVTPLVCRAPPGRRDSPEPSGKAGSLEVPSNSFAQEDLHGRPTRKQFVNNRISLPPS